MLVAKDVQFRYRRPRSSLVLSGLNMSLAPSGRTVLLGINGAGKTTLLKLLSGYLTPDSGSIAIGNDDTRRTVATKVAWMPQQITPVRGLTVQEQVSYAAWLSGQTLMRSGRAAGRALELVDLADLRSHPVGRLSGGQLRRVGLAEALATDAEILLLDEPTAGLDPAQRQNFNNILLNLPDNRCVLVSTHHAGELHGIYDRLALLSHGHIEFEGKVEDFLACGLGFGLSRPTVDEVFTHWVRGGRH